MTWMRQEKVDLETCEERPSGGWTPQALLEMARPARRNSRTEELQAQITALLPRLRMAVVHGGDKEADGAVIYRSHNPRSWKSYETVARDIADSLERLGAPEVAVLPDDMRLGERLRELEIDLVWLNSGGVQGHAPCSHAAAMLEMMGVPYVGHEPMTAAILDAKHIFKRIMIGAGVPTAEFMTWNGLRGAFDPHTDERFQQQFRDYAGPFIVKPVSGRASLNVEYVETIDELAATAQSVYEITNNDVMIERYLGGREYCVAIAGPVLAREGVLYRNGQPFVFGFTERVLSSDERIFTSMDKSPITGKRVKSLDPSIDHEVIAGLETLAVRVFEELNLETLVRLDVRADNDGRLYVLETNPKPDLKAPSVTGVLSIVASGLDRCGMSYDDLILSLLADRIDLLLSTRGDSVQHLLARAHEATRA